MKLKTSLIEPLPEDVHDRIRFYREKSLESHKKEIQQFRGFVFNGVYPRKCVECVKNGLRFCRFWLNSFDCEKFGLNCVDELIERML